MKYPNTNDQPEADTRHCANTEYGERCARLGVFSWSTMGGEKWFCRQHFFPSDPPYIFPRYDAIATLPDEQKKADHKDWARRILYRKQQGESLPMLSVQLASEALA